ncbi:MAG: glycosyltransferase family 2 protein [Lachnospiraceae bacterium]
MNPENPPFFSIVMPVYNVEKYIEKAVESIRNQTYTEWELILVDDCSLDNSGKIAKELAIKDQRIQVLCHVENKGLSRARNSGEKVAKGAYIWFMDSDDFVESTTLQAVYDSLQKNPAKVVVFGLNEEYYNKDGSFSYRHQIMPEEHYYTTAKDLRTYIVYLERQTLYGYSWNKIYNLTYLRELQLQYEEVRLIEDIMFNVKFCMDIDSMNTLPIAPYHYAKRINHSLTNKIVPEYFQLHKTRIQMLYDQHVYWKMDNEEVRGILGCLYARYILSAIQRNCYKQANTTFRKRYQWCGKLFQQELFNELIPVAKAKDGKILSLLLICLKKKSVLGCLAMGRAAYIVSRRLPMLFTKVRSKR